MCPNSLLAQEKAKLSQERLLSLELLLKASQTKNCNLRWQIWKTPDWIADHLHVMLPGDDEQSKEDTRCWKSPREPPVLPNLTKKVFAFVNFLYLSLCFCQLFRSLSLSWSFLIKLTTGPIVIPISAKLSRNLDVQAVKLFSFLNQEQHETKVYFLRWTE